MAQKTISAGGGRRVKNYIYGSGRMRVVRVSYVARPPGAADLGPRGGDNSDPFLLQAYR